MGPPPRIRSLQSRRIGVLSHLLRGVSVAHGDATEVCYSVRLLSNSVVFGLH